MSGGINAASVVASGSSSSSSMENSRNSLRRIARHDETEFSNQSIFNAMDRFVKSVNTMDETILVPCRLMDLKVGDEQQATTTTTITTTTTSALHSADLFDVYNMLNAIKEHLVWGQGQSPDFDEQQEAAVVTTTTPSSTTQPPIGRHHHHNRGHVRRPSTVSVSSASSASSSVSSSSVSDCESELGAETDSGIEETTASSSSPSSSSSATAQVAHQFRRHLHGLTRSLRQLADAAHYLTTRYQHDIGAGPI